MPTAKTQSSPERTVSPTVEGRPVRVLIIDDDKVASLVIRSALAKEGWRVTESGTAEGLEHFDKSNPDAVLVDLSLEAEASNELCLALRSRSQTALPILVMVHPDSSDAVRRAYETGATDFVFKPVDLGVLPFRLQSMIRASRSVSELRESERRLRKAQRVARLGSWELHPSGNLLNASEQALSLLGVTASELPGYYTTLLRHVHPRDRLRVHKLFLSALGGVPSALEHRIVDSEGSTRIVRQETEIATTSSGDPIAFGTIQDITELRQTQEKLFRLHFYDTLTGLPNHLYLDDHLDQLKEKGDEGPFAAIVFKLMNFKRVNGSFGRDVGDDMLKAFAERLSTMVESADRSKRSSAIGFEAVDVIARTGSAEFSLLLTLRLGQQAQLEPLARQIAERLAEPFDADGTLIVLSLRTGIAVSPDAGTDAVSLVENARFAIHQRAGSSSGNVHFHTNELHSEAADSFLLENDLRFALQKEEFTVHYQPKFNVATGRVSGVEALVRWKHPKRGLVSPGFFIPIAESSGLILPLGEWVLRQGVLDIEILSHSMVPLSLAVNLSPRQFSDLQLLERIRRLLNDVSLDPKNIELEVTEGALIEDTSLGQQVLTQLKELGLRVALDDFGTGFSSLSYLKRYPFDVVKIDRSFIQDIADDASSRAIVKSSVELAHHLGKSVVAEGVETEEQLEVLRQLGCDEVQGFLLCRPLAMDDLTAWLANHLESTAAAT